MCVLTRTKKPGGSGRGGRDLGGECQSWNGGFAEHRASVPNSNPEPTHARQAPLPRQRSRCSLQLLGFIEFIA